MRLAGADRGRVAYAAAATFVVGVSVAALGIGLPTIAGDVGATQGQLVWISAATSATFAAVLLPAGAAARRWGRRRVLAVGLAAFAAAELLTAVAVEPVLLIVLRVLSGAGAACVLPSLLAMIVDAFPRDRRSVGLTLWAVLSSLGASLGGLAAGLLLEVTSWRVLPLVVGLLAVALLRPVVRRAPGSRDPSARVDVRAALQLVAGLGAVVVGLVLLGDRSGASLPGWLAVAGGVASTAAFARGQVRSTTPMIDLRPIAGNRDLQCGVVLAVAVAAAFSAVTLTVPQYVQFVLGASALDTALLFLAADAGLLAVAPFVPAMAGRLGLRALGAAGAVLLAVGLGTLALLAGDGSLAAVAIVLLPVGVAVAVVTTSSAELIVSALTEDERPLATAVTYLGRDLGAAVGGALVGAVLVATYRAALAASATRLEPAQETEALGGYVGAVAVAGRLGSAEADRLLGAAETALASGVQSGIAAAAVVALISALVVGWRGARAPLRHAATS